MKLVVFHGSPRKGNTYFATGIFLEALSGCGDVQCTEIFLPKALPAFCIGCQQCLGSPHEKCPREQYVTPIFRAMMEADALLFTTPHYGACSMSGAMKNLLDHLDFLTLNVAPRAEIFSKKAFILTTGAGSTAAAKPIRKYLKNWGINRVSTLGLRMFTNRWDQMPKTRQRKYEKALCKAAVRFYQAPPKGPYLSTVFMYYLSKVILKKFVGEGAYPYEVWKEKGYFDQCPLWSKGDTV